LSLNELPESWIVVIPIVPDVDSSKVHVPVVVKPPAVIVPVVVSLASFFKKASSTLNVVLDKVRLVPPV
jgi:hypothetical protein